MIILLWLICIASGYEHWVIWGDVVGVPKGRDTVLSYIQAEVHILVCITSIIM